MSDELKESVKSSFGWIELGNYAANPEDTNGDRGGLCMVSGALKYWDGSSWSAISSGGSTAYDDIANPDANSTIAFAGYTNTWTSTLDTGSVFTISNTDAALAGATYLVDLKFADDGEANGVFLRCLDNSGADAKFTVGADGATTIAGNAAGTDALAISAGDVTMTSGHLNLSSGNLQMTSGNITITSGDIDLSSGDIKISADSQKLTLGASDSTDSYLEFDGTDLTFYDSSYGAAVTLSQLTTIAPSPTISGDVTISDGKLSWTDATDEVAGTWSFAGTTNNDVTWTSSVTTANSLAITADSLTSGSIFYAESSEAGLVAGNYFEAYNGSATVFEVGKYGAVTINGNDGSNVLTVTAGDVQVDDGKIEVDVDSDATTYVKRNQGTTTGPVVEFEATNTGDDDVVLLLDQNSTQAVDTLEITSDATAGAIHVTTSDATATLIDLDVADSQTGRALYGDLGPWLGTADQGAIELISDSAATVPAGQLLRLNQQGTGQHASAIGGSCVYVADAAAAPAAGTSYAMYISAANIEALHVDDGNVKIDDNFEVDGTSTLAAVTQEGVVTASAAIDITIANTGNDVALTVTQNDTTNNPDAATIDNTGTGDALFIDQDGEGISVSIDSEATTANVIDVEPTTLTTGYMLSADDADALTTGGFLELTSDSADTSARHLVSIVNDNAAAIGANCLFLDNDANSGAYALEIDRDSSDAATVWAVKIDSDNAGGGVGGGIDFSGMAVDEPILKGTADAITAAGTLSHQIPVDIGGTVFYLAVYTTGS